MNKKYLIIYIVDIETTIQEEFSSLKKALERYNELRLDNRIYGFNYGLKLCEIIKP